MWRVLRHASTAIVLEIVFDVALAFSEFDIHVLFESLYKLVDLLLVTIFPFTYGSYRT